MHKFKIRAAEPPSKPQKRASRKAPKKHEEKAGTRFLLFTTPRPV